MSSTLKTQPILARDIMAKKVHTVHPDCAIADAMHLMLTQHVSGIPLVDQHHNYIGMFSEKCCLRVLCATVEKVAEPWKRMPVAHEIMATHLYMLKPHDDVFDAISTLLKRQFSGAPISDPDKSFLGVFSEKTSMSVLVEAAYSGIPTSAVSAFANPDRNRIIDATTDLMTIARIFVETPYRRLPVVTNDKIVGQVSRSDVLKHSNILQQILRYSSVQPKSSTFSATQPTQVHEVADTEAETISPDMDLLGIAERFLNTPYRRFPVLENGKLLGLVSRRDVMAAALELLKPKDAVQTGGLFLSAVDGADSSRINGNS